MLFNLYSSEIEILQQLGAPSEKILAINLVLFIFYLNYLTFEIFVKINPVKLFKLTNGYVLLKINAVVLIKDHIL